MIKFRHLLNELYTEKELFQKVDELSEIVKSGDWQLGNEIMYRGKRGDEISDADNLYAIKETTPRRGTKDTASNVDTLIHGFYKNCYPDLPDRRNSRFATTDRQRVSLYGNQTYIIIPHETANISCHLSDPVSSFERLKNEMTYTGSYSRGAEDEYDELDSVSKTFVDVVVAINGGATFEEVLKLPCLDELQDKAKSGFSETESHLYECLLSLIDVLLNYFGNVDTGYPDRRYGEIIFQGKYIEVHEELFEHL